jgi:hypothetical protein
MEYEKKQQIKGKPRGRPWPTGVSGNPAGRPPGSKNRLTLAMLEGIKRANAELGIAQADLSKPRRLDAWRPYEICQNGYLQDGRLYHRVTHQEETWFDPIPQRERLDRGLSRLEVLHLGRHLYLQDGHLYDPATNKAVPLLPMQQRMRR